MRNDSPPGLMSQYGVNYSNLTAITLQKQHHESFGNNERFGLLNARSVSDLHDFIVDNGLDIFALTETWLSGDEKDNFALSQLLSQGFNIVYKDLSHIASLKQINFDQLRKDIVGK